ncbi:MAG: S8 family serine peptidase [Deltaproteobacteria bacterium]|nr:S8 family serine peptidase [Deltaproteobacteria bacterium]
MLEQIGAHHAYAKGLTGKGVRIGVDDTAVDFTQNAEFGSRTKLTHGEGAKLYYDRFVTGLGSSLVAELLECEHGSTLCIGREIDSRGQRQEEIVNNSVRRIVRETGMPLRDDSAYIVDSHYVRILTNENEPYGSRWWAAQLGVKEVPTPYGEGSHGTAVASVAAGTRLGVAPEASIIPIAQNLTADDQADDQQLRSAIEFEIESLPAAERRDFDKQLAAEHQDLYAKFDIINRSYGRRNTSFVRFEEYRNVRWALEYVPNTLNAWAQVDTPATERTIVVYAAGNNSDTKPGLGAALPSLFVPFRGHTLAVVATDPTTGMIAPYSNRCGRLPSNWNAASHGRHYCLAAPGTVRGLAPDPNTPGRGNIQTWHGTSFAAPMVSGGLALLIEHFRGTRGNTAVVKRMLDTADRSGQYGDLDTYGAGFLDLQAAFSPVGTLKAGRSARSLRSTILHTPVAFGPVAQRVSNIELAAFDRQDFPFWIPLSSRIVVKEIGRSPIPVLDEDVGPAAGLEALSIGQRWTTVGKVQRSWLRGGQWVAGFGPSSASLARQPSSQGWGYGLSFNDDGYLGSRTSGAFGSDLRSGFSWVSRTFEQELDARWSVKATGTLAFGAPRYENSAIFKASPSVLSAMSIRVGTETTGLTLEQALRAETGTGTFRIENGQIQNGRRLYDEHHIHLRPDSREVRMTLRHEHDVYGGRIALEAGATINAGHIAGARERHMGLSFRRAW